MADYIGTYEMGLNNLIKEYTYAKTNESDQKIKEDDRFSFEVIALQ